jgi:hypothetical protein
METNYQVGDLIHYRDDDPKFVTLADVKNHIEKEYTEYYAFPVGIWKTGSRAIYPLFGIFMHGEYFVKIKGVLEDE